MKKYLKCLIFAAFAALILSLPNSMVTAEPVATVHKEAVKGTQNKVAEIAKPPDPPPVVSEIVSDPVTIPDPTPAVEPALQAPIGDHEQLLAAAGIANQDWYSADKIIQLESSWRTWAVEPTTGACGLAQELPCGKSGCATSDAICTLKWANKYVTQRYGTWQAALAFHYANNWY